MSVVDLPRPNQKTNVFHWTVDTFYRASDAGVFDEPKMWELVKGELWNKEPVNPPHAETAQNIADAFRSHLPSGFKVREEKPVHLSSDSEPVPDVSVVIARDRGYGKQHPGPDDILVVVEVTDTSVHRDMIEKPVLYARAGITEYWVSLISTRELVVFRRPSEDGYQDMKSLHEGDVVHPLALPDVGFAVSDLLARQPSDRID